MKNRDLEILARALSKNTGINIFFKGEGAYTDGNNIYLPENINPDIIEPLLATLLHEAYHIKHTQFTIEIHPETLKFIANALEDIRIDARAIGDYNGARDLYKKLIDYYSRTLHSPEAVAKADKGILALKDLILKGYGADFYDAYKATRPDVLELHAKHAELFDYIIKKVKEAKNTDDLKQYALKIHDVIFGHLKEQAEKEKQEAKEQAKQARQGAGQAGKDADAKQDAVNELYEKADDVKREHNKKAGAYKRAKDPEKQKELEKEMNELKKDFEQKKKELDKANKERDNARENARRAQNNADEKERRADNNNLDRELDNIIDEIAGADIEYKNEKGQNVKATAGDLAGYGLNGLNNGDLVAPPDAKLWTEISFSVKELFLQFLKNHKAQPRIHQQGKINAKRIHQYFDLDHLFKQYKKDAIKPTELIFVLDNSGSMKGNNKRETTINAFLELHKAIDEAIYNGDINADTFKYSVMLFGREAEYFKTFDEEFNENNFRKNYTCEEGSTNIEPAINLIEKDEPDTNTKRIVIILTDGELQFDNYEKLYKTIDDSPAKYILIGIMHSGHDRDGDLAKRFESYNIRDIKELDDVFLKAIEENI